MSGINRLTNGSFEDPELPNESFAHFSSVAGWTALAGGQIEIWRNALEGVSATNGFNSLELDHSEGWDGFYQDIITVTGLQYTLSFDAMLRPGGWAAGTQQVEILWDGAVIATLDPNADWTNHAFTVTAAGALSRLTIREVESQSADGIGAMLDNFALMEINAAPVAVDDTASVTGTNSVTVNVLANDTDANSDALIITAIGATAIAAGQTLTLTDFTVRRNADNTLTITPLSAAAASHSFQYTVSDGTLTDAGLVTVTVSAPPPAGANLLINGSFELPAIADGSFHAYSSIPGWTALAGGEIEVWRNALEGVAATDGVNSLELDFAGGRDGFQQSVTTQAGQTYTLTLDARLRPGHGADTQQIEVVWNGTVIATLSPSEDWGAHSVTVTGTGGSDTLTIREVENQSGDGIGAMLDNLRLVANVPNTAPVAAPDTGTTTGAAPVTLDVLANDTDAEGNLLSVSAIDGQDLTSGQTLTFATFSVRRNVDGTLTVTPFSAAAGQLSFNYTVSDGALTDTDTVTVTVDAVPNAAPVANDDTAGTIGAAPTVINVLSNDTDANNDPLSVTAISGTAIAIGQTVTLGNLSILRNASGTLSVTPLTSAAGIYTFNYTVSDGSLSDTGQVTFTVTAPVATGTNLLVNGSFELPAIADGSFHVYSSIPGWTALPGGEIEVWRNALEGVTATDGVNSLELDFESGRDGFSQTVTTEAGRSYTLTLDARLRPGHDAATQQVEVVWNGVVVATLTPGADWDDFSVNVTGTGGADTLTLREVEAQSGDGIGAMLDTVRLIANAPPNAAPAASDDAGTTTGATPVTLDVLANDTDPDSNPLSVTAIQGVSILTDQTLTFSTFAVRRNGDGTLTVTPLSSAPGAFSFNYTVSDGALSDTGIVSIAVNQVPNAPPVATDDTASTNGDAPVTFNVLTNDTDPTGPALSLSHINSVSLDGIAAGTPIDVGQGFVFLNPDGTLTFTPDNGFTGTLNFDYTVTDGEFSDTGLVSMTVGAPVAPLAGTNLVINGSFEVPMLPAGTSATVSTLPGWFYSGPLPVSALILDNAAFASDGDNYLVLHSTNLSSSIRSRFETTSGGLYLVSFDIRANPAATGQHGAAVFWNGLELGEATAGSGWQTISAYVPVADSGTVNLSISADPFSFTPGPGALIDNVRVVQISAATGNTAPVSVSDLVQGFYGQTISIPVLANDSDPNGNLLRITHINGEAVNYTFSGGFISGALQGGGQITVGSGGVISYTPGTGFAGQADFTYTVSDGAASSTSTVLVNVSAPPPDSVPANNTTTATLARGASLNGAVDYALDSDWYRLTLTGGEGVTLRLSPESAAPVSGGRFVIRDQNGIEIASSVSADDGSQIVSFVPTASGIYYADVRANSGATGNYALSFLSQYLVQGAATGSNSLTGSNGADRIIGGTGSDDLNGLRGDDILEGGDGNDIFNPGAGNDTVIGGNGLDRLSIGGLAMPTVTQSVSVSLLTNSVVNDGFGGVDVLSGIEQVFVYSPFADRIEGGGGDDLIFSYGAQGDTLLGGDGIDQIGVDRAPLLADGGAGSFDLLSFLNFPYAFTDNNADGFLDQQTRTQGVHVDLSLGRIVNDGFGGSGVIANFERLLGTIVSDRFIGDVGNNHLSGRGGADYLDGGDGDDEIVGGAGADMMTGSHGSDTFQTDYTAIGDLNGDTILDFEMGDRIVISNAQSSGMPAVSFIGTRAFSNTAGEIRYGASSGSTTVEIDRDGNGVADERIKLTGVEGVLTATAGTTGLIIRLATLPPSPNLLSNGSFEDPLLVSGTSIAATTIRSWTAIAGGLIEVQRSSGAFAAPDQRNAIDLDASAATDGLSQQLRTVTGEHYTISLDARLQTGNAASQQIQVLWNNLVVATFSPGSDWSEFAISVTGTGGIDTLTLREVAAQGGDGIGALIDDVRLSVADGRGEGPNDPAPVSENGGADPDLQGADKSGGALPLPFKPESVITLDTPVFDEVFAFDQPRFISADDEAPAPAAALPDMPAAGMADLPASFMDLWPVTDWIDSGHSDAGRPVLIDVMPDAWG